MRPDFDEIRTLTKRFALIPQKVAKFVFGVFRYADLSVLGDYKLRKAIKLPSDSKSWMDGQTCGQTFRKAGIRADDLA